MTSAFRPYRRTVSISNASEVSAISSKTNGCDDNNGLMDVYRESQINGFRRWCKRKGTVGFVQVDEEENTGSLSAATKSATPERPQLVHSPAVSLPILEKTQLDRRSADLCKELRTVLQLTEEFRVDVIGEKMSSFDLLAELASKIRPFLVRLDEDMASLEETVKKNIDRCLITDQKVDWLLRHNKFMLSFRGMVERLTVHVYDELERVLRLKVRGVHGAKLKEDVAERIKKIGKMLDEVEKEVMLGNTNQNRLVDDLKTPSMCTA